MKNLKIKIYGGLSVSENQAKKIITSTEFSNPIQRGDLLKDIRNKTNVVVIFDGKFEQSLAVSPIEILDAIRSGILIFGASSMGALRAAELRNYGMIGHGKIFELIYNSNVFRDDLLGQVFDENGKSLSLPYIDFYFNGTHYIKLGKIQKPVFAWLCNHYLRTHYANRTFSNFMSLLNSLKTPKFKFNSTIHAVKLIFSKKNTQKNVDAISTLHFVTRHLKQISDYNHKLHGSLQYINSRNIMKLSKHAF